MIRIEGLQQGNADIAESMMDSPHGTCVMHSVRYAVQLPGETMPYYSHAPSADEALRDALHYHGQHFAPPGTTITLIESRG